MNFPKIVVTTFVFAALTSGAAFAQGTSGTFPPSGDEVLYRIKPAQAQYLANKQHALNEQGMSGARGNMHTTTVTFPSSGDDVLYRIKPAQERYFDQKQRAASDRAISGVHESVFPHLSNADVNS